MSWEQFRRGSGPDDPCAWRLDVGRDGVVVDRDGLRYVCNREGSRTQVYDKMGQFIKNIEAPWKPVTPPADGKLKQSGGSSVALALSRDSNETFMYLINQNNSEIEILYRKTGQILSTSCLPAHFPVPS